MDPERPATCVLLMGLPASGKSSFYHEQFRDTHVRVNKDMLKTANREKLLVDVCVQTQMPFVVDKVNETRLARAKYIPAARAKGFRVIGYYFRSDPPSCVRRNALREGAARIPVPAIYGFAKRFEPPTYDEGFDELYMVTLVDGVFKVVPV